MNVNIGEGRTGPCSCNCAFKPHPVFSHDECQAKLEAAEKERDHWREEFCKLDSTQAMCCWQIEKERDAARAEVDKLKRIIAQELRENDELGSEFVYVNALKERVKAMERVIEAARQAVTAQKNLKDLSGPVHRIMLALQELDVEVWK